MRLKEILLATNNNNKAREIKKILNIKGLKVVSLSDMPQKIVVKEDGKTFAENAVKKSRAAANRFGIAVVADDSGLCVDALNGAPGIRSARFVRPPVTAEKLCRKLLCELKDIPENKRTAAFVCAVALSIPGSRTRIVEGRCKGRIIFEMKGQKGFGYDPVFMPVGYDKTFAQMSMKKKNDISHRAKAFHKLKNLLQRDF